MRAACCSSCNLTTGFGRENGDKEPLDSAAQPLTSGTEPACRERRVSGRLFQAQVAVVVMLPEGCAGLDPLREQEPEAVVDAEKGAPDAARIDVVVERVGRTDQAFAGSEHEEKGAGLTPGEEDRLVVGLW